MLEQLKEHLAFELNGVTLLNQDRLFLLQPIIESLLGDHAKYKKQLARQENRQHTRKRQN